MKFNRVIRLLSLATMIGIGTIRVSAQCSELYGVTYAGGEFSAGTIFKTDCNGDNLTTVFKFPQVIGLPNSFVKSGDKLYGLYYGDESFSRAIYEYDLVSDTLVLRFTFPIKAGIGQLVGSLTEGPNGKFYGVTQGGGLYGDGVIYEWDPSTNELSKVFDFKASETGVPAPASLIKAKNGKLYGTAGYGGKFDSGTIFEFDADSGKFAKLYDFNGQDGSSPHGQLLQSFNGKIYGTTRYGGQFGMGVLYEFDPDSASFTKRIDFSEAEKGKYPKGALVQASNGKIYGTAPYGGSNGHSEGEQGWITDGVLFEWDPVTNIFAKKFNFKFGEGGYEPDGTLIKACGDKLYGTTAHGGAHYMGALFEWDIAADSMIKKFNLDESNKMNAMTVTDSCTIVGVLNRGSSGAVVKWDPVANSFTEAFEFYKSESGIHPVGHLIRAANNKIYGMTNGGGLYNGGVLFEWDPATTVYSKKLDFEDSAKGYEPAGSLIQAQNGKFYGMTSYGGSFGFGVIFEWDPATGAYHKAVDFNGEDMGGRPWGNLVQAKNGKLYGTTPLGGIADNWGNANGILFELDPETGIFEKKVDFDGAEKGRNLAPALNEAPNGKLYGIARSGGRNGKGVLFEWDPDGNLFTKKLDFSRDTAAPTGSLLLAGNGRLYGITTEAGIQGDGVIFEWDPLTDTYSTELYLDFPVKHDSLNFLHGCIPYGSMVQGVNGRFYGMAVERVPEARGHAVLFEYDPVTDQYLEKTDTVNGMEWYYYSDGLTVRSYFKSGTLDTVSAGSFLSPSGRYTWTSSGTYTDTIPGVAGCDSIITVNLTIVIPTEYDKGSLDQDISLFPNPTAGNFTVDMGKIRQQAEVVISQIDGRVVQREQIVDCRVKEMQLQGSPGLYLVTVISGNERAVFKLSKKK